MNGHGGSWPRQALRACGRCAAEAMIICLKEKEKSLTIFMQRKIRCSSILKYWHLRPLHSSKKLMIKIKEMKQIVLAFFIFFSINTAMGQVSMMDDVSTPYLDKLIEIGEAHYAKFKYTEAKVNASKAALDKTKCGIFDVITLSYVYLPANYTPVYSTTGTYSTSLNGYQFGIFLNVGSVLQKPSTIRQAKEEYKSTKFDKEVVDGEVV